MKKLRVLLLMHEGLVPPESIEGLSEQEMNNWRMEYDVLQGLRALGHDVHALGVADQLVPIREAIEEWRPHVVFNLLMHFHDVCLYDSYVVSYLELLKTAYTGCNPRGLLLSNDKALAKKILGWHRIRTPRFKLYSRGRRVGAPTKLDYPLFVKSATEHASLGIAQASVVHDFAHLEERVAFIHDKVGTDALAEEYIEGRELTVTLVGNHRLSAFPPWELFFESLPEGSRPIATSRLKWDLAYQKKVGAVTRRADVSPEVLARIEKTAKRLYRALGLSGFARIDLKLGADDSIWVLEANPNPDLTQGEDVALSAEAAGLDYCPLLQRLLTLGQAYTPAWKAD